MKTEIEIWDNTEENKCVHSFVLHNEDVQKLSIRLRDKPRSSVFIDVHKDKAEIIGQERTTEHKL